MTSFGTLFFKLLATVTLVERACSDSQTKNFPEYLDFRNILIFKQPIHFISTKQSRKGHFCPVDSITLVNLVSDKLLTFLNSSSNPSRFMITKVSSTYSNQIFGGRGHLEIALVSIECINKLAKIKETDDVIATPFVYQYKSPLKPKNMGSRALVMSEGPNQHPCFSSVSKSN